MILDTSKLVSGEELLRVMFTDACRPKIRWLREQQKRRRVPYYKIGQLVFFDPVKVREHWEKKGIIRAA